MKSNALRDLANLGQSPWLDYIRRDLITSGEIKRMIDNDGLGGMTSNPAIFEKAIASSHYYDDEIRNLAGAHKSVMDIYETLICHDVQSVADEFQAVYRKSACRDGYISLEVNPHLAYDTEGTIREARRLWFMLDRPNVLIKVPATDAGIPAIRELISEGINVNVTLIFGIRRYREVAEAYISGLEARIAHGKPVRHIASVASFFLSRIDTLIDPMLDEFKVQGGENADFANDVRGETAISCAKAAYQIYKELFLGTRFEEMVEHGASTQRLLWASTSAKNPAYSDVKYVEPLIGPDTVNTMPPETMDAYRDHGEPKVCLEEDGERANCVLQRCAELGINLDAIAHQLEDEGVVKFIQPFDKLLETLAQVHPAQV